MSTHVLRRPVPAAPPRRRTPQVRRAAGWSATLVLGVAIASYLALALGPHVLGYRTAVMLSDSMTGAIDRGDLVVSVPTPVRDVEVGDVLTFHTPTADRRLETHRVIAVRRTAGEVLVRTQGDANADPDPWEATLEGTTAWRTAYVVPHLGTAVRLARLSLRYGTLWVALTGCVALGLIMIWRPEGRR